MTEIPKDVEWIRELIPDLSEKTDQFVVELDELDDELIMVFIEEILRLSGELKEGVDSNNMEMVRQSAHSIKGMGGTIGLPEVSVLALEIENIAKQNDMARVQELSNGLLKWVADSFQ